MRDAGAKVAVELTDQDTVRLLLRAAGSPLPVSPAQPPEQLQPPPEPFTPAQIPPTTDESSRQRWPVGQKEPPAPAAPPPVANPPVESPPGESPPAEEPPPSGPGA
jgi:hypothetical protein